MTVRAFSRHDLAPAQLALLACGSFTSEEVGVAGEMLEAGLEGGYHLLAVATPGGFAGYVCAGPAPLTQSSWYLYWICLRPEAHGTGLAYHLLAGLEAEMRGLGGNRLVVETSGRKLYERARHFYVKAGFEGCGRIPDFYGPGDDCVLYCKSLPA